jgi:streptomycin 6-kinase
MHDIHLPAAFLKTQHEAFGEAGIAWASRLTQMVAECAERWSLKVGPAVPNLSFNWVAHASRDDGTRVILKIGFPEAEARTEIDMLRLCDGRGMVRLLEADPDMCALLLERLEPGISLWNMEDDEQATAIYTEVAPRIWHPAPDNNRYATVTAWAQGLGKVREQYGGGTGPIPAHLLDRAESLFHDLLSSAHEAYVLHGDLHHDNILSATRAPWLAIDPKGVVGERAYDTAAFMMNPTPEIGYRPDARRTLHRRVDQVSEALGLDRERVRSYGIAFGVLSGVWSLLPDGTGWEPAMRVAELLLEG